MKNILKARLRRNPFTRDSSDYKAQVIVNGNLGLTEIIDELLKENTDVNRESALNIINAFNRKAAELVVSGYIVNTGLVSLSPVIKNSFYGKKWNPNINSIDVSFSQGYELRKALNDTDIELVEEQGEVLETQESFDQCASGSENTLLNETKSVYNNSTFNPANEPPCGIAFRRWLCNS